MKNQIVSIPAAPERSSSFLTIKGDFALHPQFTAHRKNKSINLRLFQSISGIIFLLIGQLAFAQTYNCPCATPITSPPAIPFGSCSGPAVTLPTSILPFTIMHITGTVIAPTTTYNNVTFLMDGNAQFLVPVGVTLTMNACTLKAACSNFMWNRVFVEGIQLPPGVGSLIMNECLVEESENGVMSSKGGNIQFTGCTFRNNLHHNQIFETKVNWWQFVCSIKNCTYECPDPLLLSITHPIPPSGFTCDPTRTFACINIIESYVPQFPFYNVTIGDASSMAFRNTFSNAEFGIRSQLSNFILVNADFDGMDRTTPNGCHNPNPVVPLPINDPACILSISVPYIDQSVSRFKVGGSTAVEKVNFTNSANGIIAVAKHEEIDINNNAFENIRSYGISINDGSNVPSNPFLYKIRKNRLTNVTENIQPNYPGFPSRNGVISCYNNLGVDVQIYENIINITNPSVQYYNEWGIKVREILGSNADYRVINNQIFNKRNGILLDGLNGVFGGNRIEQNTIQLFNQTPAIAMDGILAQNCDKYVSVTCNKVFSPTLMVLGKNIYNSQRGIRIASGKQYKINCNITENIAQHMVYESPNQSSTLTPYTFPIGILGNSFAGNGQIGFRQTLNGDCGNQGTSTEPSDNTWNDAGFPDLPTLSSGQERDGELHNEGFVRDFYVRDFSIVSPYNPAIPFMIPGSVDRYNTFNNIQISHSVNPSYFQCNCQNSQAGFSLEEGDTTAPEYLTPVEEEEEGGQRSTNVESLDPQELSIINGSLSTVQGLDSLQIWEKTLSLIEKLNRNTQLIDSSAQVWLTSLENTAILHVYSAIEQAKSGQWDASALACQSIQSDFFAENYFKSVYSKFISNVGLSVALNESDSLELNEIAQMCYINGGPAVLISRTLLNMIVDEDSLNCGSLAERRIVALTKSTNGLTWVLSPNPAKNLTTLNLLGIKKGMEITFRITDIVGKEFNLPKQSLFSENSIKIIFDISSLVEGMYLISIYNNDQIIGCEKLIILN